MDSRNVAAQALRAKLVLGRDLDHAPRATIQPSRKGLLSAALGAIRQLEQGRPCHGSSSPTEALARIEKASAELVKHPDAPN
ncbi:hypothetical protein ARTHRO9V_280068 [Arthrobacter sp. 9V]|uniref:hypothetical protein n=1 Tax=Arthrobacter sp. 9V TaxID=2653132 RepID=UPI0012EFADCF|nr:hypothetical protein [Arthrobacter sp. 9V]VXC42434.1 hypothetical protein ARTHRO9V_280068 [Arthrobacter sp. 9V]